MEEEDKGLFGCDQVSRTQRVVVKGLGSKHFSRLERNNRSLPIIGENIYRSFEENKCTVTRFPLFAEVVSLQIDFRLENLGDLRVNIKRKITKELYIPQPVADNPNIIVFPFLCSVSSLLLCSLSQTAHLLNEIHIISAISVSREFSAENQRSYGIWQINGIGSFGGIK